MLLLQPQQVSRRRSSVVISHFGEFAAKDNDHNHDVGKSKAPAPLCRRVNLVREEEIFREKNVLLGQVVIYGEVESRRKLNSAHKSRR